MLRALAVFLLTLLLPALAVAQQVEPTKPAVLIADNVFIEADRTLVAQGNVEAFQGGTRLQAKSIRYNEATGGLTIEGPIVLTEGTKTLILADAAQLSSDMQNGILTGARLVLNQQLQLAAQQINRTDGRYSQLYKTTVTSCRICEDGRAPLWQIRAKRVVHDRVENKLYFDEAQFRILRVPVFYVPRLRLPGPGLDRATGFLVPSIRTTSQLGTGLKLPYFIKLGDHRDLTLTPYISTATRTLEFRYRQAFARGRMQFDGAITRDDERPDATRGYLIGRGAFNLERDYTLTFDIEAVNDNAYFSQYDYYNEDRLESQITIERARRDAYVRASIFNFESLRVSDINDNLPTIVLDGEYERRFFPSAIGGEVRLSLHAHSHTRASDLDVDGPDADLVVDGRDVVRLGGKVEWLRRDTLRWGLVADTRVGASFQVFDITQDSTFDQNHADLVPHAAVALRYPMVRRASNGIVQTLEPVAQLGWVGGNRLDIPNDESTRTEFDEGNLLSLSRFAAPDRRERGFTAAVGVNWARFNPNGWDAHLTVGQVLRRDADPEFSNTSGLSGGASNFLLAGQIKSQGGLSLSGRSLFDESFNFAKAELRGDWYFARGGLSGSYVWMDADADEDRPGATSEILLNGNYAISRHWAATADYRFDIVDDRSATAGLGLTYNNECVSMDLAVERRYSSSTSVEPTTNFGFNVGLRGFAVSSGTEKYMRSCQK